MAIPQHQFQQQQQQSGPINFYNSCSNLVDQTYPQFIPPFHVAGLAPGDVFDGGDLQWAANGVEISRKALKEQDFLDNNNNNQYYDNINNHNSNTNSQISSVDFLQTRPVSTGLGLSLDDRRNVSCGETPVYSLFDDEIAREFQRQDAEIDHFIKVQGERMRRAILEKVQANQFQTIALAEEMIAQKLLEKEAEVESIDNKNNELEEQIKQLIAEAGEWQHRAKLYENFIDTLKSNIQLAQNRDVKEGCGDSEVDDTASCCNSGAIDFHLIGNTNKDFKESITCKVCKVNQVCMLLLPCRHLCLCKDCESKLSFCPLCQCSKFIGMEILM
ncbi:hypothetical protein MKW94_003150 [Papaver nudicaule]|uniref:RING-type domain-containing protein n=1 Tax=Papaver nudicaule TaxID=74823 RepID=A0AA41V874_PAPNU|nr:hypothetical protein [Papaver nudicaule]